MVYIKQNAINTFILRLQAMRTSPSSNFLWVLENGTTHESINFILDDVSNFPKQYNKFDLTTSDTGSLVGGYGVPLKLDSGQHTYKIYETAGTSLEVSDSMGSILETGIFIVELYRTANTDSPNDSTNVYH